MSCTFAKPTLVLAQAGEITESLELDGAFAAALPMRLNSDALSDLVIFRSGSSAPSIVKTASAKTLVVNSADDHDDGLCNSGDCTLREALNTANSNRGADTIAFNIPGAAPHTITLLSSLPDIEEATTIDGTTQPDFHGLPVIQVRGKDLQFGALSCFHAVARGTTIRGLTLNNFFGAISISQPGGSIIEGNLIGTDPTGMTPDRNGMGIAISASDNVIGGRIMAARNVISGNSTGIQILGDFSNFVTGNLVEGNFIGTDLTGTMSLGNGTAGVRLGGASNNTIGGVLHGARNVISGNFYGVLFMRFFGVSSIGMGGNSVQGNYIGTNISGSAAVPNSYGVWIDFGESRNIIGGTQAAAGNIVAFNQMAGISITGFRDDPNGITILHNSIFSNIGLGIELDPFFGPVTNDPCDLDEGPNHLQNFPVLSSVLSSGLATTVRGTLNSTPGASFTIELFANDECDPSGFGEGKTYIASTTVTTGADCNGAFNVTLPAALPAGQFITATATDPAGNTSEFSQCIQVQQGTTFDRCLQDDSNGNILLLNSTTGAYQFSNCRGVFLSGVGSLLKKGCLVTLQVNGPDRRIQVRLDTCSKIGSASIQLLSQGATFTIADRNTSNDTCVCAGPN